jgi:hypothetical protein
MKITKTKNHVLLKNKDGEYHLSHDDFNQMGEDAAIKMAESEIAKKLNSDNYKAKTINFDQARELGFCEYGIKDFCEKLDLDINDEYEIPFLLSKLTVDAFLEYTNECRKLFGKDNIMAKFGGVKQFLSDNRTSSALNFVLSNGFIEDKKLHLLACDFAERVLPIFEKEYPEDNRPRRAIEVKRLWIEEEYKG